ncbi:hypothetical protein DKM44_02155 [Deinococcus irradiatisoli]|uniref:Uncharacterized protein n=1 Tax=Deinococcus irradiatisoli TaxID=2202254 RepID=A0A2Z3JB06_9DEIO|nr:hypothetical protein [Deinococcus irradiatisoli]AWN22182.1 hypothetical protein DKM44_02155 [Deinococcus irradiatisoli]
MTGAELTEIKARFQAGTETRADFRALLNHAENTPTIGETIELLKESEAYWERVIVATNPVTGPVAMKFTIGRAK